MEAARTSETSVDNYLTRQYIPEDNSEHTRRRKNLKSHKKWNDLEETFTEVICVVIGWKALSCRAQCNAPYLRSPITFPR